MLPAPPRLLPMPLLPLRMLLLVVLTPVIPPLRLLALPMLPLFMLPLVVPPVLVVVPVVVPPVVLLVLSIVPVVVPVVVPPVVPALLVVVVVVVPLVVLPVLLVSLPQADQSRPQAANTRRAKVRRMEISPVVRNQLMSAAGRTSALKQRPSMKARAPLHRPKHSLLPRLPDYRLSLFGRFIRARDYSQPCAGVSVRERTDIAVPVL